MAGIAAASWFALPIVQSLLVPTAPGGERGPWVLRPAFAFRFGACAVLTAITTPLVMLPLRKNWRAADAAAGTLYDPFHGRPGRKLGVWVGGTLLLLLYGTSLAFYLLSWTTVGSAGIGQRLPWGTFSYPYEQIAALETVPDGMRSESLSQDGPWFAVTMRDGRRLTFGVDNEGISTGELLALATHVALRSGRLWTARPDATRR
jgi:hypothetical protein